MCGELKTVTRQEMRDFVLGKPVPVKADGNVVELMLSSSPENKQDPKPVASKPQTQQQQQPPPPPQSNPTKTVADASKENQRPPSSFFVVPQNKASTVRNPYSTSTSTSTTTRKTEAAASVVKESSSSSVPAATMTAPLHPPPPSRQSPTATKKSIKSINATSNDDPCPWASVASTKDASAVQNIHNNNIGGAIATSSASKQPPPPPPPLPATNKKKKKQLPPNFLKPPPPSKKATKKQAKPIVTHPYAPGPVPLCPETRHTWIYPEGSQDFPTRQYQLEITETALKYNTLVSLPTGLGKTHIAAVVLYNYYRWFPQGKLLFLAPTLPLVNQQVQACYQIMGLPAADTALLTGRISPKQRLEWWTTRRVFYCTPQTVQKDFTHDADAQCFAQQVVCVVLDEAHKASGDYAYTKVIELLEQAGAKFRIVGLSATPGTNIKAINAVVQALRSVKIEARMERHPSVAPYLHEKRFEYILCPKNDSMREMERGITKMLDPILEYLRREGALRSFGNATLTTYSIFQAMNQYKEHQQQQQHGNGNSNSNAVIATFYAAQKLVELRTDAYQSLGIVKTKMLRLQSTTQRGKLSTIVKGNEFKELLQKVIEATTTNSPSKSGAACTRNTPKLTKLAELLNEHFQRAQACDKSSRAIVFSQYRDSVSEIAGMLSKFEPMIRPRHFVGQGKPPKGGSDSGRLKGMKQSEQHQAIKDFRENRYNVLVCTCIGEEGLDIGEVDLIINYDTLSSPIRMIQRTGRTGRKRNGRVVCLISEGQEERKYNNMRQGEKTLTRALESKKDFIMTSHTPIFPSDPKQEFKKMKLLPKLHMSQIAGTASTKPKTSNKRPAWSLTTAQEEERQQRFGLICGLDTDNVATWKALRRIFLRGRSTRRECKEGRTVQMLRAMEHFGPTTIRNVRGLLRGKDRIKKLFPLERRPEKEKEEEDRRNRPTLKDLCRGGLPSSSKSAGAAAVATSQPRTQRFAQSDQCTKALPQTDATNVDLAKTSVNAGPEWAVANTAGGNGAREIVNPYASKSYPNQRTAAIPTTDATGINKCLPAQANENTDPGATVARIAAAREIVNPYAPKNSVDPPLSIAPPKQLCNRNNSDHEYLPQQRLHTSGTLQLLPVASQNGYQQLNESVATGPDIELQSTRHEGSSHTQPHPRPGMDERDQVNETMAQSLDGSNILIENIASAETLHTETIFRLPTPPPSSSSEDEEEESDDEQSLAAKEPLAPGGEIPSVSNEKSATLPENSDICFRLPTQEDESEEESVDGNPCPERYMDTEAGCAEMQTTVKTTKSGIVKESLPLPLIEDTDISFRLPSQEEDKCSHESSVVQEDPQPEAALNGASLAAQNSELEVSFRLPTQDSSSSEDDDSSGEEDVEQSKPQPIPTSGQTRATEGHSSSDDDMPLIALKAKNKNKQRSSGELANALAPQTDDDGMPLIALKNKNKNKRRSSGELANALAPQTSSFTLQSSQEITPKSVDTSPLRPCLGVNQSSDFESQDIIAGPSKTAHSRSNRLRIEESPGNDVDGHVCDPFMSLSSNLLEEGSCASDCSAKRQENSRRCIAEAPDGEKNHGPCFDVSQNLLEGDSISNKHTIERQQKGGAPVRTNNNSKRRRIEESPDDSAGGFNFSSVATQSPALMARLRKSILSYGESQDPPSSQAKNQNEDRSDWAGETPCLRSVKSRLDSLEDTPDETVHRLKSSGDKLSPQAYFAANLTDTPVLKSSKNNDGDIPYAASTVDPEDIPCSVCFSRDSLDEDPILLCDGGCNLGFHQFCYSVDIDFASDEPWLCDKCNRHHSAPKGAGLRVDDDIKCKYCSCQGGPLKFMPQVGWWCHPLCAQFSAKTASVACSVCSREGAVKCFSCRKAAHPHCAIKEPSFGLWTIVRVDPTVEGEQEACALFCPNHSDKANEFISTHADPPVGTQVFPKVKVIQTPQPSNVIQKKPTKRLKKLVAKQTSAAGFSSKPTATDVDSERDPRSDTKEEKVERLKRRRKVLSRFVLEEAEIKSDEDGDGDESETELRKVDEEEMSHDSFINDSMELTQHFSQDNLADIDPDASVSVDFHHRVLDAQRDRDNQFKTPLLNRRMQNPDSANSQVSSASDQGLGKMNFIRSVLEHHRQGGRAEEIEAYYRRVEREEVEEMVHSPDPSLQTQTVRFGDYEEHGNQQPNTSRQSSSLTEEQRERIEQNRLAALRRRQERGSNSR